MRVSISNIAWDPPLDDAVGELLRGHGVDAVDVAPGKYVSVADASAAELEGVRAAWERRGCEITGMQSLLFGATGLEVFGSDEARAALLERLTQVCRVGAALGATRLVFGSPRNRDVGDRAPDEVVRIAKDFFTRVGDVAHGLGTRLLLEPNPREYGATWCTTSEQTAAVVREIGHPGIGMTLDLGAVTMNGEDAVAVAHEHADIIGHVHVSAPQLAPVVARPDLTAVAPRLRSELAGLVACIEMLTGDTALPEIDAALAYVTGAFGGTA